jgi:hypothetical protein
MKCKSQFLEYSTSLLLEWLSSITNVGDDVGKKKHLYTVDGNIN